MSNIVSRSPKALFTSFRDIRRTHQQHLAGLSTDIVMGEAVNAVAKHANFALDHHSPLSHLDDLSITTMEEIVGLAQAEEKSKTRLLEMAGVQPQLVNAARDFMRSSVTQQLLMQEFDKLLDISDENYPIGLELEIQDQTAPVAITENLPATATLIDEHMPDIRDQGFRGTCVAFSSVSCLEYYHNCKKDAMYDLSEQFAFWNMMSTTQRRNLAAMFPLMIENGCCPESMWPYVSAEVAGNPSQGPPPAGAVQAALGFRCRQVTPLPRNSVSAIKEQISANRVVAVGIPVFDSWYRNPAVRLSGNIGMPVPGEQSASVGHAIALVGYGESDDFAGGGYFIVRNSWGTINWGTRGSFGKGYGTIPYPYIEKYNWDAWCITA